MRNPDATTPPSPSGSIYRFCDLELDAAQFQLRRGGEGVHLEPKAFRVLLLLVENRHRAVPKEQILAEAWPDVAVTDNVLTRVIAQLRKALGDNARVATMIETVPTVGYRFVADVEVFREPTIGVDAAPAAQAFAAVPKQDAPASAPARRQRWRRWIWALVGTASLAAVVLWIGRGGISQPEALLQATPRQITAGIGLDATPSYSPDGANMVYASDRSGRFEIYSRSLSPGAQEVQLTNDDGQNVFPRWSPDGKWIAYVSAARGGIFVLPALGGSPRKLTDDGTQPAWLPDSEQLVYRSGRPAGLVSSELFPSHQTELRVVNLGRQGRSLVDGATTGGRPDSPAPSPDGRWVVFVRYVGVFEGELMAVRLDGTALHTVVGLDRQTVLADPVFHPDGRSLHLVVRTRNKGMGILQIPLDPARMKPTGEPREVLNTGILAPRGLALRPDGRAIAFSLSSAESNLYSLPVTVDGQVTGDARPLLQERNFRSSLPAWSRDGSRIAFAVRRMGEEGSIWIANADGSGPRPVSSGPLTALDPLWSANNREVYFSSLEEIGKGVPARVLYALDLANLSRREVLRTGRVTGFPRISPDETLAVYHSQQGPKTKLFLQRPGDEGAEELATGLESPGYPVWLPDSSGILLEAEVGDSTQVFLMDVRTRRSIPITKSPGRHWPGSVSPDLRRVAFASLREGVWNVWWVDRQTGEEQMLTRYRSPRSFVRYPVWSPAGDRMVFEFAESKGNIYEVELR